MANHNIDMRLMGTEQDLEAWAWFIGKMQDRGLVEVLHKSNPYPNKGESKLFRLYLKIDLKISEE